jgi:quinoprotein glucose dehydrogenase
MLVFAAFACGVRANPGAELTIEDPMARAALPMEIVVPAASPEELTPSNGALRSASYRTWTVSHGDAGATRYSSLDQINRSNVHRLREAWRFRSGDGQGGLQANPIVVKGTVYAPTPGRAIVALDGATGVERWRYQVETPAQPGLDDAPARRGLVYWDGLDGRYPPRVVFASGKWVYALDPGTGKPLAGFGQGGRTPLPTGGTAVGVIWKSTYIVPGFSGDVFAYDLRDGRLLWRFHTVPRAGEFGADTWIGAGRGNAANPWGGVALDEKRAIVYVAVGAPRRDYIGVERAGDNLFGNCVVALDARDGRRLWHFQNVRHDIWDLDNPAPPNLVTITRDGREIDAVACVSKTGATLLLDRVTGKTIFPFELRRAPVSRLPGEVTAAHQPDPRLPEPFAKVAFTRDDITDRTPEARASVEFKLLRANMGWYEPFELGKPTVWFGIHGGAEWTGASIDVPSGRLYVSANHIPWIVTVIRDNDPPPLKPPSAGETVYQQLCAACHGPDRMGLGMSPPLRGLRHSMDDAAVLSLLKSGRGAMPPAPPMEDSARTALLDFLFARDRQAIVGEAQDQPRYTLGGFSKLLDAEGYPGSKPPWGTLNCIDLNTGRRVWSVPLGEYPEFEQQGLAKTGTENFGGPMVTAGGLVFCAGTRDGKIRAFDKDTGDELWSSRLPWGGNAPPATYEIGGRQYILIAATGGGKIGGATGDAWVAYALPPE